MKTPAALRLLFALGLLIFAGVAPASPPPPFSATYRVLRDGQLMGDAQVTLQADGNGQWTYRKHLKGSGGLAALLGAELEESSTFRWKGDLPEAISYDYRLDSAIKSKQRHLRADWKRHQVSVDEGKGVVHYPTAPGMVERNTTALAVGLALRDHRTRIALPVAVRQRVETQRFAVVGHEAVKVPAGSFAAVRVERSDAEKGFSAWYVPDRYPLPVKLSQRDGGDLTMQLVRFQSGAAAGGQP